MSTSVRRGNSPVPQPVPQEVRPRDIDYAAAAVRKAILEKFARQNDLQELQVIASERTIRLEHQGRLAEGTRDNLLAAVRKSADYTSLWRELQTSEHLAH